MYKTLHKKQGSVTVQLRFARSSVTFCAKRDISSYAQKIPDGPAPMMITSKCSPDFISQVSFRVSIYGHQDRERSLHTILYRIIVLPDTQDERNENQIIDMGKNTGKIV